MKTGPKYATMPKKKKPAKKTVLSKNDYKNLQGTNLDKSMDDFFKRLKR